MIEVSDGLTPTLTGTTIVEVTVTGNNDAAPAFTAVTLTDPTVSSTFKSSKFQKLTHQLN